MSRNSVVVVILAAAKRFVLGDTDIGPVEFNFWPMEPPKFDGFVGYNFFERQIFASIFRVRS